MQQVMSAPPQNLDAMYTDLGSIGGSRKGMDCAKVLGTQEFLHKGDVFFTCLRHMLYSSRPLYAHCRDPTWRDAGVLAEVESIVEELDPKPKAKTLSWLSVLLRLRCARDFRKKLRMYIRDAVVSGVNKDMMKAEPEQHAPDRHASAETKESTDIHDKRNVIGMIASVITKSAAEIQSALDERAKKVRAGPAFDRIVHLRHLEVAMCATGVDPGSDDVKWVRENAATNLTAFFGQKREGTEMMKVARMYGALFVSPSAMLKYMPPLPAQARGLPDSASRAESILLTWIGRRLSSDIDLDAAWKVRDLLIATMRVQYVGYEPEWWGWQFARCVHDYAEHGTTAALGCVLELVTELQANPYSADNPERQKPRAANAPQAKGASQYKGAYSEVYAAALLGDEDARKLIIEGLKVSENEEKAGLIEHAKAVIKRIGSAGGDLGAWREYEFCVALLHEWKVPFEKPSVKKTLVSAFYQKETEGLEGLGTLAKAAVNGTYEQIDELRRILDPEQRTLVPIPKAALRMLRGFIKTSETFENGPFKVVTDVIQKHADVDITADVSTAKMISEAETHRKVEPKEYVLLRRVEELLFAMRQVEMLSEQLFPRTATWTTDGYMRRLAYGVRVDGTNYVPLKKDGTWTIGDEPCVHVGDNVVNIGRKDKNVSTPSYAQWVKGVKVARRLAELAIDAWAPAQSEKMGA
jgi:hypothetical protein